MFAHVQAYEHYVHPDLPLDQVGNLDAAGAIEREAPCGLSHERKGQGRLFLQRLSRYDDTRGAQTCSKAYTTGTGSGRTDARARRCVDRPVPKTFIGLRLRQVFWILFSKSTIRSRPVLLDDTEPITIYVILMTLKEDTKIVLRSCLLKIPLELIDLIVSFLFTRRGNISYFLYL